MAIHRTHSLRPRDHTSLRPRDHTLDIPFKANRVLNCVMIGMLLITLRVWHLAVIQYDEKLEESRKPQRRTTFEAAKRATIRDRFNIPLAINKVQYQAAIVYSQIRQIPTVTWTTDEQGIKVKKAQRKEYIKALSELLGQELDLNPERVEDLIHAKASLYNQVPFVIKDDLTEKQYYRLKMLEQSWPGISTQILPKRYYTKGKIGGDLVGYIGAINKDEYDNIILEIKNLENHLDAVDSGEFPPLPEGLTSTEQVHHRLKNLHELAYAVNDSIGKAGIELYFEKDLRGFRGKKSYYSDARGNFLRELPGTREPIAGKRILLTISSELQEFAEQLLIQNEQVRRTYVSRLGGPKRTVVTDKEPWIKGSSIIAMDPVNGEILAMASHPRIDPNDFIASGPIEVRKEKTKNIHKWLENEPYLADIWNEQRLLDREIFDSKTKKVAIEQKALTWSNYLDIVLSKPSLLRHTPLTTGTIADAVTLQHYVDKLLEISEQNDLYPIFNFLYDSDTYQTYGKLSPTTLDEIHQRLDLYNDEVKIIKNTLDTYLSTLKSSYEQVLLVDLMRLAASSELFSDELLAAVGQQSLSSYKTTTGSLVSIQNICKRMSKDLFHEIDFKQWRQENEKEFLKQKRLEEKTAHRYAKPYIDYLDKKENELFDEFWLEYRWTLLTVFLLDAPPSTFSLSLLPYIEHFHLWFQELSQGAHQEIEWKPAYDQLKSTLETVPPHLVISYMQTMREFQQLDRPLIGRYRHLRKNEQQQQLEKHLAAAFYPKFGYGYGRSHGYRQATTQGSLFKMVTAYEALVQQYEELQQNNLSTKNLNPLTMVDKVYYKGKNLYLGYDPQGNPLPRHYKGGRLPRSSMASIGEVDLIKAIETSSNPYFALLAGDVLKSPQDLNKAAELFSFGNRTGVDLPGEIKGRLPTDLETNRTGLYAFSIGQHSLVVTPLQTSVMLAALANGGVILKPKIVDMMVGKEPQRMQDLSPSNCDTFSYQGALELIGIDFPLFIATDINQQQSLVKKVPTEVKRSLFMPSDVQYTLLDGMCRVVGRTHGASLTSLSRIYRNYPEAIKDYVALKHQLVGKTSTAESVENIDLDPNLGTNIYTHTWFGGIVYPEDVVDKKEHHFIFQDSFGNPELVVVVYLKYGGFGKEAAPLAAQMAKRWREIKEAHQTP